MPGKLFYLFVLEKTSTVLRTFVNVYYYLYYQYNQSLNNQKQHGCCIN